MDHQTVIKDQEEQDEQSIDLVDYVARLDEQERLAKEEMPFDTSRCSLKRLNQSIYSCRTCFKATGQLKGVCYACSISCHTRHDLVDLGFRRAFKCDCGGTNDCNVSVTVTRKEGEEEEKNNYEKAGNFASRFCYCLQLHDPDNENRVMIQCLLCLDWFHDSCITNGDSTTLPNEEVFDDFFCLDCSSSDHQSIALLRCYLETQFSNTNDPTLSCCQRPNEKKRKLSTQEDQEEKNANDTLFRGTFLPLGWRSKLCRCSDCHSIMKEGGIDHLLEKEAQYTPPIDPTLGQSSTEIAMNALGRMDRIVALDSVSKFNSLKNSLSEFLSEFAKDGRVVGSTDISTFFETLAAAARNDSAFPSGGLE